MTLAVDVSLDNSSVLFASNVLTLEDSRIELNSGGDFTALWLSSPNPLVRGNGEIVFGGSATGPFENVLLCSACLTPLIIAPGVTVRSGSAGGSIGTEGPDETVFFRGTLVSDLPGRAVTLTGSPVTSDGDLLAGAGAAIEFNGPVTLFAGATLSTEISGSGPAGFGRFIADSAVDLNGALDISIAGSFLPSLGETFGVFSFAAHVGAFNQVNGTDAGPRRQLWVEYSDTAVDLRTVSTP